MARRLARIVLTVPLFIALFGMVSAGIAAGATKQVYVLPATGTVDNVMAQYLSDGVAKGTRDGVAAVVVQLNTPGGSLEATNKIVGAFLTANVPVIVWVAPAGGYAASAGTFITLSANLAYMAPGTRIGAASPVGAQGQDIPGTEGQKVKADAIANIRSIAEQRGRNVEWAIRTVDQAYSSPATEAVAAGAVDGIAPTLDDVLNAANGQQTKLGNGETVTVDTAGATTSELPMNPFQSFLHLLSDPNIAFILFTIGFYGLLYEVISPNFVTGILGGLALILAFIGFGSLPLNVAGLILIGLGILLFVLELTVMSHGLLTVGGLVCLALGASALYTEPGVPTAPDFSVALPLIATMTLTTAAFMAIAIATVVRSRRRSNAALAAHSGTPAGPGPGSGIRGVPAGTIAVVRRPVDPLGVVFAAGEEWSARTVGPRIDRGAQASVVGQQGLTLIVEPVAPVHAVAPVGPVEPVDRDEPAA